MTDEIDGITHQFTTVNGINLHYVHGGYIKGRPLFPVHGLFETWRMWRRILPQLTENHYVVAVDMRGYGETDKSNAVAQMDKGSQAADFYELAQQLDLGRFVLVGHERGARAARRYALNFLETLLSLTLLDILPTEYLYEEMTSSTVGPHHWDQLFHLASSIAEQLLDGNEETYIKHFFNRSKGFLDLLKSDGTQ